MAFITSAPRLKPRLRVVLTFPSKDVHNPHTRPGATETLPWEVAWDLK